MGKIFHVATSCLQDLKRIQSFPTTIFRSSFGSPAMITDTGPANTSLNF